MARGKATRPGAMAEAGLVNRYVESLRAKTASRRSTTQLRESLVNIERSLESDAISAVQRMALIQRRTDIHEQLAAVNDDLEEQVVGMLKEWAAYKGFSYATMRAVGIPANVLDRAGVPKGDKP